MILLPLALTLLAQSPAELELQRATLACERDVKACPRKRELQSRVAEEQTARHAADEALRREAKAKQDAQVAAELADWERREDERKAKCGADYGRVRVGMRFSRVQECATLGDEFELIAQTETANVYRCAAGTLRVEAGRVKRWIAADL